MKIYQVGGSVRDELMGRTASDVDYVVVGATADQMLEDGFTKVGADFPVFLHPSTGDEYALARTERKTAAGYHGFEVEFDPTVTLLDDLRRRDLTINAMARDLDTGEIIDPFNGQADIKTRTLRHVSEAFAEDPVRVLRVARFAARFNFEVAPETIQLMRRLVNSGELDELTEERVWQETTRAVTESEYPHRFFEVLNECGAMERVWPFFNDDIARQLILTTKHMKNMKEWFELNEASKFARLSLALPSLELAAIWLESMRAPRFVVDVAQIVVHMNGVAAVGPGLDAANIMVFYEHSQALHHTELFDAACSALMLSEEFLVADNANALRCARDILAQVRAISFADLSDEQKKTLKGRAIGDAIFKLRLKFVEEQLKA